MNAGSARELNPATTVLDADYRLVTKTLERYARTFRISPDDAEELVADVLFEAVAPAGPTNRTHLVRPGAYLFTTTRNRVFDLLRRARLHPLERLEDERLKHSGGYFSSNDDDITRLLDRQASAEMMEGAMRAAAAAGDGMLVRVVGAWLDLAEQLGDKPTTREVAKEAGTTHTTVRNALERLKAYLPREL